MKLSKPNKWVALLLGGLFFPLGFLYVMRPLLAVPYFFVALIGASQSYFLSIFLIASACHCYFLVRKKEETVERPVYARWYGLVLFFGLFVTLTMFVRTSVVAQYKSPASSMIPTLQVNDVILVNKLYYGLKLPFFEDKLTVGNPVQRGDVMVFRYPPKPSLDYIKRVVGVPGDEVAYLNKQLTINGQPVPQKALPDFFEEDSLRYIKQFEESLPLGSQPSEMTGVRTHRFLNDIDRPAFVPGADEFVFKENCHYTVEGVTCKVPAGHYFMMGDNRDNSLDSRYWGFVPEKNIVGKAFFVWMNFGSLKRIGAFQ
jgi:signal peptidase I